MRKRLLLPAAAAIVTTCVVLAVLVNVDANRGEVEIILNESGITFPDGAVVLSSDFTLEDACRVYVFSKVPIPLPLIPGQVLIGLGEMTTISDDATTKAVFQRSLVRHKIGDPKPGTTVSRRWSNGDSQWRDFRMETDDGYYVMLERMKRISYLQRVLSGCGGPRLAPVTGVATTKGAPLTGGTFIFSPIGNVEPGQPASAKVEEDGTFVVTTNRPGDGALIGRHRVSFTPPPQELTDEQAADPRYHAPPPPYMGLVPKDAEVDVKPGKNSIEIELGPRRS